MPDNPSKKYPSGVGQSDLNKTVTRTINVTDPHTGVHAITQTAKLTRTATVDEVDGTVKYSDWKLGNNGWTEFDVPVVEVTLQVKLMSQLHNQMAIQLTKQ